MSRVLVVDDELSMREFLEIFFIQEGHMVDTAENGRVGIELMTSNDYDLVITDLRMPGATGIEVLAASQAQNPDRPVIVMTAFASTTTAIDAMKRGAYDYLTKPFKLDVVKATIDKALEKQQLISENKVLKAQLSRRAQVGGIIGRSEPMQRVFDLIRRVARTRTNVLILGESGTGKELVAQAIHRLSDRRDAPFLVINCGAIPENLLESELFGHRKGTFTGAASDREGVFQAATGGTLFLDEIGEMPLGMQVKLLRVLQEKKVKRVGDHKETPVDVRIVAATNRELTTEVEAGRFREDLYYRLDVISIEVPPLRDRPRDIPLLAEHFLKKYTDEFAKPIREIEFDAMQYLLRYSFPGNVRELENMLERAVALEDGPTLQLASLSRRERLHTRSSTPPPAELPDEGIKLDDMVEDLERRMIGQALARTGGHKKKAATLLGISFRQLRYRLDKLKIGDG